VQATRFTTPADRATAGQQSIGDIPHRSAARHGDKLAIIDGDTELSFIQFSARVDAVAAALQHLGLVKGDVLAVLSRNNWQMAVLPFAAARAGVVLAPINFLLSAPEVAAIVRLAEPKAFVAEEHLVKVAHDALELAGQDRPEVGAIPRLALNPGARAAAYGWPDAAPWFEPGPVPRPVAIADDDVVRLMFTSGTEALPKGVMLTSRSLMWQYVSTVFNGGFETSDVDLHFMPLYHCAQLDVFLGPDLYVGATSVILQSAGPARIIHAIERHGINKLFATPSKWIELLHSPIFSTAKLAGVTKGYYGASPMPVPVLLELQDKLPGLRLWNFYGQTEMSPAACILPPEDQLPFAGSAGKPALNVELAILDPNCRPVPDGVVGEVAFRSPHACLGYLGNPTGTEELFRGGWLHTGDLGYRSETGRLSFVDRVKDTVNVGGEKVSSREVEETIYRLAGVQECAVIGVPDPRFNEAVVAVVVPCEGAVVTADAVKAHVGSALARFKTPKQVIIVETLPKNASGKILKRELRDQYQSATL
jgi:fatty-acyl-CoA synthase